MTEFQWYTDDIGVQKESLKSDQIFLGLLRAAAKDKRMRDAQDKVADELYWLKAINRDVRPRQLRTVYAYALALDLGTNTGIENGWWRGGEQDVNLPNMADADMRRVLGVTEEELLLAVAKRRLRYFGPWSDEHGFPGLRKRCQAWVDWAEAGNWKLDGMYILV